MPALIPGAVPPRCRCACCGTPPRVGAAAARRLLRRRDLRHRGTSARATSMVIPALLALLAATVFGAPVFLGGAALILFWEKGRFPSLPSRSTAVVTVFSHYSAVHSGGVFPGGRWCVQAPDTGVSGFVRALPRRPRSRAGLRLLHLIHGRLRGDHPGPGRTADADSAGRRLQGPGRAGLADGRRFSGAPLPLPTFDPIRNTLRRSH